MGISTAAKGEKGSPMFFPNLKVFEVGACIIFFLFFFAFGAGGKWGSGGGGLDVSSEMGVLLLMV